MDADFAGSVGELTNADYLALEEDELFLGAPLALCREAPVYRSVSELLLAPRLNAVEEDVYRSVAVRQSSEFSEPAVFGRDAALEAACPSKGAFHFELLRQNIAGAPETPRVASMRCAMAQYAATAVHAFTNARTEHLIKYIENALTDASVDFRAFDARTSSFAATAAGFRFDIYVLELLDADKAEHGRHIIELQRMSSGGLQTWSAVVSAIMSRLRGICEPTAFFAGAREVEEPAGSLLHREDDAGSDMDVDQEELDAEYSRIVSMLCDKKTSFENKHQLALLLAQLASEKQGAEALLRAGALSSLVSILQGELVVGNVSGDLNCALLAVLANLAAYVSEPADMAAYVAMEVLRNGSSDVLQIGQLRNAAKALALLVRHVHDKAALRPKIKDVVLTRCAACSDRELASHSNLVLRNLALAV